MIDRLAGLDLRPQALLARIPFVVVVIGSLGVGLAITLWLSTDAAQRSYQLGNARAVNDALAQQKEALEREVLQAESAPALAEAARELGMIPSRNTAHLVLDPAGNWVVVGQPKPAEGAPPPPLNTKLPDEQPPASAAPVPPAPAPPGAAAEIPVRLAPVSPWPGPAGIPGVAGGPDFGPADPADPAAQYGPVAGPAPGPVYPAPQPLADPGLIPGTELMPVAVPAAPLPVPVSAAPLPVPVSAAPGTVPVSAAPMAVPVPAAPMAPIPAPAPAPVLPAPGVIP